MYLKFMNLRVFPFSTTSEEKFFYESAGHAEALASMVYAIQQRKGLVLITGEVGAGKTFLSNVLASRLRDSTQVIMIAHPPDSAKQLLRALAEGLGVKVSAEDDKLSILLPLEKHLEKLQRRGRQVAVIFDEVQTMPDEALEEVRLIWNWEREGQRLLQIVLIGQPQLMERLRLPRWDSLQQRVAMSYHLGPLSQTDTARYILHHRKVASYNGCPLRFTVRALESIHSATRGIPRLINVLCDNALLAAYAKGTPKITSGLVAEVLRDMTCWGLNVSAPSDDDASEST